MADRKKIFSLDTLLKGHNAIIGTMTKEHNAMVEEHKAVVNLFSTWHPQFLDGDRARRRMMLMITYFSNGVNSEKELNYGSGRCFKMPSAIRTKFAALQ